MNWQASYLLSSSSSSAFSKGWGRRSQHTHSLTQAHVSVVLLLHSSPKICKPRSWWGLAGSDVCGRHGKETWRWWWWRSGSAIIIFYPISSVLYSFLPPAQWVSFFNALFRTKWHTMICESTWMATERKRRRRGGRDAGTTHHVYRACECVCECVSERVWVRVCGEQREGVEIRDESNTYTQREKGRRTSRRGRKRRQDSLSDRNRQPRKNGWRRRRGWKRNDNDLPSEKHRSIRKVQLENVSRRQDSRKEIIEIRKEELNRKGWNWNGGERASSEMSSKRKKEIRSERAQEQTGTNEQTIKNNYNERCEIIKARTGSQGIWIWLERNATGIKGKNNMISRERSWKWL